MKHQPVLVTEILNHTEGISRLDWCLDATFGRGGHTLALKNKWPKLKVLALDQDLEAVEWGKKNVISQDIHIRHLNFHHFNKEFLSDYSIEEGFDMILLDLGPSSPQLDCAERGFSFYKDGPLDMRMNQLLKESAADIVNGYSDQELMDLFRSYGEIRNPWPVVRSIIRERQKNKITTTLELARLIEKASSWKGRRTHPATKYFLALRIAVNNELEGLKETLTNWLSLLRSQGRIFVISFHSLEDRIVKNIFKQWAADGQGVLINKKVIQASSLERNENIRSRSAKLRVFQKGVIA